MKKIIFLVTTLLSLSIATFAGCDADKHTDNKTIPDASRNLLQEEDCDDGDCKNNGNEENFDFVQPIPRTPHASRRTSETDDSSNDGENKRPDCKPHKRHKHRDNENLPVPRPAPVMPK